MGLFTYLVKRPISVVWISGRELEGNGWLNRLTAIYSHEGFVCVLC